MVDFQRILTVLCETQVRFVIIGGAAAAAHGSALPTYDLDLCYERSRDNIARLAEALEPHHPYLRDVPGDLPFRFDAATITSGMNFTLATDLGELDLFGEVAGIGAYQDAHALSTTIPLFGFRCSVLSLEGLIRSKRATSRPKDLLMLREIEALREMEAQRGAQAGPVRGPRKRHIGDNKTKT